MATSSSMALVAQKPMPIPIPISIPVVVARKRLRHPPKTTQQKKKRKKRKIEIGKTLSSFLEYCGDLEGARFSNLGEEQRTKLLRCIPSLMSIHACVGQPKMKRVLLRQVLQTCLHGVSPGDTHHFCLLGPPGVGKTMFATLICRLYRAMGLLSSFAGNKDTSSNEAEPILMGTRETLISEYVGQTMPKTMKLIRRCQREGKALFVDEVYQLINEKGRDTFGKETVNSLNQSLLSTPGFILIVAGYREESLKLFFGSNQGLRRRFKNIFVLEEYGAKDLRRLFHTIFSQQSSFQSLEIDVEESELDRWFSKNQKSFPAFGGDIHRFVRHLEEHSTFKSFGQILESEVPATNVTTNVTLLDFDCALKAFLESRGDNEKDEGGETFLRMYM